MTHPHLALISISIELISGVNRLREATDALTSLGEIITTSSIYKRYLNERMEDLNSELVLVAKIATDKTLEEIYQFLIGFKSKTTNHPDRLVLLVYDNQVRLLPGQNLPNPLLRSDGLTLRCASEAWGGYEHPVLGQTLNELVRSNESLPQVEFFAQGRSLFQSELS